jgi:glycosyltransferase involved in cell wall biosynthesis
MVKVTYILSLIFKSLEYEWIVRYLDRSKIELTFILLNPHHCELQSWLETQGVKVYFVPFYGKKSYAQCTLKVFGILRELKPDFVNCNLLDANMIGLTAARFAGVPNRIHTRHHSTFHHVYFKKGRIYDYYANYMSTQIVAVSSLVKKVLVEREGVDDDKVRLIPHGFGIPDFENVQEARVNKLKVKYDIADKTPVIGAISRYIEWKGVQYIVPAFAKILNNYPNAVLLIANARQGTYSTSIINQLSKLPKESYREIEFESDVLAFYKLLDVFIHTPIDDHSEAFGRIYPESLASGVPLVCTISGIAHDIIEDGKNALVVPYKNAEAIADAVQRILKNTDLSRTLSINAKTSAADSLNMNKQKHLLENLYLSRYEI